MYDCTELKQPLELEMSHVEAAALLEFLERLIDESGADRRVGTLENALDKLDDADAAATWLRENVRVGWSAAEALELLEALTVRLEEEVSPEGDRPLLPNLRQRLDACINSSVDAERVDDRRFLAASSC